VQDGAQEGSEVTSGQSWQTEIGHVSADHFPLHYVKNTQ
jgi:hypothetical protein